MKEFIEFIAKHLVDNPEAVRVEEENADGRIKFRLYVDDKEIGKVIGKSGKTAKAMRTLLTALGAKGNKKVSLEIPDNKPRENILVAD